jgi:CheY-like chemotaxis protein
MLADGLARDPRNRSAAEHVIKASERAAALTGQLLAFSRRQTAQVKSIDVNALIKGMEPMLRRLIGEHINLRISFAPDLGSVHADPGQIEQVVMNLVVNARDAMPLGGRLLLETANADLTEELAGDHLEVRPGRYVMLAVTDTGVGMDKQTRDKVFEPFFTTKEKGQGTGLGLSMVYGIAKRSGGTVNLYSEPGSGTSVKVYLPLSARADADVLPITAAIPAGGWETVLLVEDEDAVRNFVRTALESKGYRVLVAASGEEAVRLSRQHTEPIHLLITDMVMPEMSGADVAKRLRRQRSGLQVLYMSGYTDASLRHTGAGERSVHFISKPFSPAALARKVRQLLDEKRDGNRQKRRAGL